MLKGGLPLGSITEVVGPECSGRTSFALTFVAQVTQEGRVCAWIDASDTLHPESAAAAGINLSRLLWVRCGISRTGKEQREPHNDFVPPEKYLVPRPVTEGLHGGGCGPHPRGEAKGLPDAVGGLLRPEGNAPQCAEPQRRERSRRETFEPNSVLSANHNGRRFVAGKPWARIDQALRVTDLLLQAGGFSAIVLDMGGIAAEFVSRVPQAMWFRYRAAAERTQASILLLTQHVSAKSSAGLVLRMGSGNPLQEESTVLAGIAHRVEIARERFAPAANVIAMRKPPQSESDASWHSCAAWAGRR